MTDAEKANLAAEAQRLKDNEAFQAALSKQRARALDSLATTNPTDTDAIRTFQCMVKVIDELRGDIEAFIRLGVPRQPAGIV